MKFWEVIKIIVAALILIPIVFLLWFMWGWSNMCFPTSYQLTLMDNTEEFDQPYLKKTSYNFDTFPTLKKAIGQLIDFGTFAPTGKTSRSFNNCNNEVDEYLHSQKFLSNNSIEYSYFAYYHHIFELIATGAA